MRILMVGLGGALGGLARFGLGKALAARSKGAFPFATFAVNMTGAVLLGMLSAYEPAPHLYLLLGDGFLGAYTTFSTFMYEGFHLFRARKTLNALIYIAASILLGVVGYICGSACTAIVLY